jgi:hypothetical protein
VSLYEAATRSPEAFEHAARACGKGWLAALRAGVLPSRQAALDQWVRSPRSLADLARWLADEGRDARLSLIQLLTTTMPDRPRYTTYPLVTLFRLALAGGPHVELPWLWVELLVTIPSEKRVIAQELEREGSRFAPHELAPPIDHVLRSWPAFTHRAMLARRLRGLGKLEPALAMRWLADPALRPIGEEFLSVGVRDHEPGLRELLGSATGGTREAIVRLLRAVDERMSLDGSSESTDDAELQTRLRADPLDATTSMVWCDLLGTRGDPRGEHISLEHAIVGAEPARALELSRAQAEVCAAYRKGIWNRPGGFPFREKYRGRDYVAFASDWGHKIRGTSATIVQRAQKLANHATTVAGPCEVYRGRLPVDTGEAVPVAATGALELELVRVLGDAAMYQSSDLRFARREHPEQPLADPERFVDLCSSFPQLTLAYRFELVWPGTRIPLPHQEGDHYSGGAPLASRLAVYLDENWLSLDLRFPFESFAHPGFLACYDAITSTLGRVLTRSRFLTLTSSADGKRMISRLARFAR